MIELYPRLANPTRLTMAVLVLAGCRDATQITVEVRTDLACSEVSDTTVTVGTPEEVDRKAATATAVKATCKDGRIGALVVAPSDADDVEIGIRVVTGVGQTSPESCVAPDYRGCIIARRALRYVPHTKLQVNVPMRANCKDVPCDAAGFTTCAAGRCVSARIDSTTCEGPGCDEPPAPPGSCATAPDPAGVTASGWTSIASLTTIGENARSLHSAVWTCNEVLVWGGGVTRTTANPDLLSFAPATNTWRRVGPAPIATRYFHSAVWTGKEMILWGGLDFAQASAGTTTVLGDGASYDPGSGQWTVIPADPLSSERLGHAAVWSSATSEMIVVGGRASSSGAAFDPATRRWRAIAPFPTGFVGRYLPGAVFVNDRVVVYGGTSAVDNKPLADAALYDPKADTWTLAPPAGAAPREGVPGVLGQVAGREGALFYGGATSDTPFFDGASWTIIPGAPASALPTPLRIAPVVWFGGGRIFVWGGTTNTNPQQYQSTGAAFDPATKSWTALPPSPLSARSGTSVVWTGRYAILIGGGNDSGPQPDGAFFVP